MKLRLTLFTVATTTSLVAVVLLWPVFRTGERVVQPLTNIHGIPYPDFESVTTVTETLAHADIFLQEPVLAKQLTLDFEYIPLEVKQLAVGVRENAFWLSYQPVIFYQAGDSMLDTTQVQTAQIKVPLTDKLADRDQTIDVMFFAYGSGDIPPSDPLADTTLWQIRNLQARVALVWPSRAELYDFIRSTFLRERLL